MFIRSNIPFMREKRLESFIDIECVAVRLKLSNSWTTFVGLYRPPSLDKSTWKLEMCNLFETVTEMSKDVFILGDFNCDMLNPDKPPNQGRDLMDIMDIFPFENLISGFDKHILSICSKVNKQLSVVKRFKHLIGNHIKRRLHNAFILPE